jgi:hypothetical protein
MNRLPILAGCGLSALAGFGLALAYPSLDRERTTLTRLAPDETVRARLVDRKGREGYRTFEIRLESLHDGKTTTLYHSPDEGTPHGTERLIWSRDGTMLLLVGRHFFVKDDLFLDNGDQLYFLHHRPSGRSWSNAAEETGLPRLQAEQVRGVEFTEPIILKGG